MVSNPCSSGMEAVVGTGRESDQDLICHLIVLSLQRSTALAQAPLFSPGGILIPLPCRPRQGLRKL